MSGYSELLSRLCKKLRIREEYNDIWGNKRQAPAGSLIAIAQAMGYVADSEAAINSSLQAIEHERRRGWLDPVQVEPAGRSEYAVNLHLAGNMAAQRLDWELTQESGERYRGSIVPSELERLETWSHEGLPSATYRFCPGKSLDEGYHKLTIYGPGGASGTMELIAAPSSCHIPKQIRDNRRIWGPALQLYALRSNRNWGMGDFGDLKKVVEMFGGLGAEIFGLNPLHGLFPHEPEHSAPYSPSNRLLLNPLYIDMESVPEFQESSQVRRFAASAEFTGALKKSREDTQVQYSAVSRVKMQALKLLYETFREKSLTSDTGRALEFRAFQNSMPKSARNACLHDALQERFHGQDPKVWGWPVWPEDFRQPDKPAVKQWASENADKVEFHEFMQWLAESQLAAAAGLAKSYGVGLYHDLALGAASNGSEVWAGQSVYAQGVSIGAPPDDFNLKGQDWGLPPQIPDRLRRTGYRPFIEMLRASMKRGGAIRLDHVIGLMRQFWVPWGKTAAEGAYVYYPFSDLLAIIALESRRNQALVIGEDLGTVPEEIRAALAEADVFSYRLLYFSKDSEGSFLKPDSYPKKALVSVTTHDLPTLRGYWALKDIEEREMLNLFPSRQTMESIAAEREADKTKMALAFRQEGLLAAGAQTPPTMTSQLLLAAHRFVARTQSSVMMAQLEDIIGQERAVNLPGTTSDVRPNWSLKLSQPLEKLEKDKRLSEMAEAIKTERGGEG